MRGTTVAAGMLGACLCRGAMNIFVSGAEGITPRCEVCRFTKELTAEVQVESPPTSLPASVLPKAGRAVVDAVVESLLERLESVV